jgi:hypothetical protein
MWLKDKPPYGGAEGIRMKDEDAMDVDSAGSEEDSADFFANSYFIT